ncbi:MAG: DUF1624 domain-containing protein [Ruminococcus sp.]|nr:DUF1624 domain-containing protein [Ruminococcus sp.]
MKQKDLSKRYNLIDAIRGIAIINMIAYHLCYDIFVVFAVDENWYLTTGATIWERFICYTFILVSGVSMNFSKHPYKRGIIVNLCGFAITAITAIFMPSQVIWFGILNLIGCAMLITAALKPVYEKLPPIMGAVGFFLLFSFFYGVPKQFLGFFNFRLIPLPEGLYQVKFLSFLGLKSTDFYSADFFPLLPWIFLFFAGFFLWKTLKTFRATELFRQRIPVLDLIGRHSLPIYLLHQPILYGICYVIFIFILKTG